MSTNSVKNTDFLNNGTKIKDEDYVFIKPINIRNGINTRKDLYYVQYKDFKNKIGNYNHVEKILPNKKLFEIFTLDEGKYKQKCISGTKYPFSFDEVAKNKGLYSIKTGETPNIKNTSEKIETQTNNIYVTFENDMVSNVVKVPKPKNVLTRPIHGKIQSDDLTLNNTLVGKTLAGDPDDENTKKFEDLLKKYDMNQMDKKKILENFKKLDFTNKVIFISHFEDIKKNPNQDVKEREKSMLKRLEQGFPDEDDKFMEEIQNFGGKATRRRKRKGKKRSKNTRKKRKSKKQRRQ